ncbi:MAG: hypothetical protein QOH57_3235 [Mycobacterium sp.]|jgi:hypothetical protein|nr:hypothetical protein [Mycobacterium sp.]
MAFGDNVSRVWTSVTATQVAPKPWLIAACAAVGFGLVLWSPAWRYARHLVTICHEGAHGVAALCSGRRLSGIRLHSDTSGLTLSRGRSAGPGMIVTAAAGYLGPGLIGLAAAYVLHRQHAVALLWGALALLTVLLVQIRNWFGLWAVLVTGSGVFAVSWWAPPQWQSAVAYVGTSFLLLAAPWAVLELHVARRRATVRDSDVDALARLTRMPATLWLALLLVGTLATLVLGSCWIIGHQLF